MKFHSLKSATHQIPLFRQCNSPTSTVSTVQLTKFQCFDSTTHQLDQRVSRTKLSPASCTNETLNLDQQFARNKISSASRTYINYSDKRNTELRPTRCTN